MTFFNKISNEEFIAVKMWVAWCWTILSQKWNYKNTIDKVSHDFPTPFIKWFKSVLKLENAVLWACQFITHDMYPINDWCWTVVISHIKNELHDINNSIRFRKLNRKILRVILNKKIWKIPEYREKCSTNGVVFNINSLYVLSY